MADETDLDAATVAVLAHGLLSSLTALAMSAKLLADTHQDRELSEQLGSIVDSQAESMKDTLRMMCAGLPPDVMGFLDEMTNPDKVQLPTGPPSSAPPTGA
jgi:hypothetical protein